MKRTSPWFIAPFLLLLAAGWLGVRDGLNEWSGVENSAQRLATVVALGYGIAGFLAAVALWFGQPRTKLLVLIWALLIMATGSLAPVVWGEAPIYTEILGGIASAAIAAVVHWLARRACLAARPSSTSP